MSSPRFSSYFNSSNINISTEKQYVSFYRDFYIRFYLGRQYFVALNDTKKNEIIKIKIVRFLKMVSDIRDKTGFGGSWLPVVIMFSVS